MSRFVKPQVVRLPLSRGDYIDVQRRLNTGQQQDMFAVMAPHMTAGEKVQLQSREVQTAKVLAYLLGWSLTDEVVQEDGKKTIVPVPMSPEMSEAARLSTLRALDPDTFREIREAVEAHEDAVEQEIAEAKKIHGSEPALSAPLLSVGG